MQTNRKIQNTNRFHNLIPTARVKSFQHHTYTVYCTLEALTPSFSHAVVRGHISQAYFAIPEVIKHRWTFLKHLKAPSKMLKSLLNTSVGCLMLQCGCVPLIPLTHLELRVGVHSPTVFLLQMGLSCCSPFDLASHCSCSCRVRTVGTVPVTNSCMTSQSITDVSIRNTLSENG